jgi:hypothetical protein
MIPGEFHYAVRYELRPVGVYDRDEMRLVTPDDVAAWREYEQWLSIGNVPAVNAKDAHGRS